MATRALKPGMVIWEVPKYERPARLTVAHGLNGFIAHVSKSDIAWDCMCDSVLHNSFCSVFALIYSIWNMA